MRSPSSSTEVKRRCRCSMPSSPPATSKWRISMKGAGFCWFLSRSFRPSPWMRNVGKRLHLERRELDVGVEVLVERLDESVAQHRRARQRERREPQPGKHADRDADDPADELQIRVPTSLHSVTCPCNSRATDQLPFGGMNRLVTAVASVQRGRSTAMFCHFRWWKRAAERTQRVKWPRTIASQMPDACEPARRLEVEADARAARRSARRA